MLIVCTAETPDGRVTRHLVRDETGAGAYRRLRPLLTPGSQIDTMSVEYWTATRGHLPRDLRALDRPTSAELAAIAAAGGQLIPTSTPPPEPSAVHSGHGGKTHRMA